MNLEPHLVAVLSFCGITLDALGGLYLAYDLLGGQDGPLSLVSRSVTYALLFGCGYGLVFGLSFGLVVGPGLGLILALGYWRLARYQRLYGSSPLSGWSWQGALRGLVLGLASIHPFGIRFAAAFGALSAGCLYLLDVLRLAPVIDYRPQNALRVTKKRFMASLWRGFTIGSVAILAGWLAGGAFSSPAFGLKVGLSAFAVSATVSAISPMIEWHTVHLPDKVMGVFGVVLILVGLGLQSIQYLNVILR